MHNMQTAALRSMLEQLDQAIQDHLEWHANLLQVIICHLPCDPSDLASNAHRRCRFGQWYYQRASAELRDQPTFTAIGIEHQRIHKIATGVLREITAGRAMDRTGFDELIASSLRLRRELDRLRREFQVELRSRDVLTGAYDREQVLPELRRWREPVSRGTLSCCVVLMDLDRLQQVNEAQGHAVGDALLADFVHFLREHLRAEDKVFRYGGDEFLVTLPGADLAIARAVVGRFRERLAQRRLFVAGAHSALQVTASFGLAPLDPLVRVEDAIDRAAQALLLARTAGGNRAVSWDAAVTTGRHWRRLELDADPDSVEVVVDPRRGEEHPDDESTK
jgi:diguanylate cyclase (GGDEF)-like protein